MAQSSSKEKSRIDLPEIQRLIRMIEKSPITEFQLEDKDLKIKISKNGTSGQPLQTVVQQQPLPITAAPAAAAAPQPAAEPPAEAPAAPGKNIVEIKAPMVGTFYRAPSPDADPYVTVGDRIESSTVMCIIEAMKLMNEVEAEVTGRIVEILVENAQPVEFNQILFRIDTSG